VECESRRVLTTSLFEEQEAKLSEQRRKPLNILKTGCWKLMNVNGVKKRVWWLAGEDVLQLSGILSWREDLQHLRNQLTEEQPGICDMADLKQMKRDNRVIKEELALEKAKEKEESWSSKVTP
jgi:hypothetical protein